jgi:DNA-binding response OmpR family regulator
MEAKGKRILLAEDDRFLRRAAEARLKQRNFTVITAADGEEALNLARTEPVDLIFLDLIMPKVQGFEVLRGLKEDPATSSIPVIVLSNLSQESDVRQALEAGAAGYLVKADLSLQELAGKAEEILKAGGA